MQFKKMLYFILCFPITLFHILPAMAEEVKTYSIDELITIAAAKNPSVAVFKANLEISKARIISAKAYPNPELELGLNRARSIDTRESKGEYSIGIGQPIEWSKKRFYRKKSAETEVGVVEKENEDFYLQLRSEVRKGFYRLLLNKRITATARENLKTIDEVVKTIDIKVKAGESPEFELIKAQVERIRIETDLKKAENQVVIAKASLNAILGNALNDNFDIEGEFTLPKKRYDLQTLLSNAIERHPLILKAKKEAEAKGYSLEMEKASVFPDVTLKGFFNKEFDTESYGIGFSIPIPFWYQKKGEIASAFFEKARAEAEIYKIKVELARSITEEYQNYTIALDQIDVFEKGLLNQAKEALRIADLSYRHGESGILDYLDSQRVYRSTIGEYYQSLFELEVSIASLERMAGH